MKYTKIPENTFKQLQINAGVILQSFTPSSGTVTDSAILFATSGGTQFTAVPTFSDMGEDIDNAPKNTMELKKRDSWEVKLSGTAVTLTSASAISMIGSADVDSSDSTKIVPRNDVKLADFDDIWLVGDYDTSSTDTNAGFVAIHLMNCLSTGGFSLQTADDEKGKFAFEYTAHYSMDAQDTVPFEMYIVSPTAPTPPPPEDEDPPPSGGDT